MENNYDNSGTLWRNEFKTKDSHPDMTGSILINGRKFKLSAWKKIKDGNSFLSISIKPAEEQQQQPQKPQQQQINNNLDLLNDF
jgi:hypothetical protein